MNCDGDYPDDMNTRFQLGETAFAYAWEERRGMTFEQTKASAMQAKARISKVPEVEAVG